MPFYAMSMNTRIRGKMGYRSFQQRERLAFIQDGQPTGADARKKGRHMKLVRIIGLTFAVAGTLTLLAACGGDDEKSGDGATPTATEGQAGADDSPPPGDTFFLEIAAENIEYDVTELTAPAGEDITLQFDNDDPEIQHNWSLYEDEAGTQEIFKGEILTGVDTIDYDVPAIDEPGTYHFHCDIHPAAMKGELIIE